MENNFNNQETSKVEEPAIKAPEIVAEAAVVVEEAPAPVAEEKFEDVIKAPAYSAPVEQVPALAPVANGVIGTGTADKPAKKVSTPKPEKEDRVAIKSTKNVSWLGVGKISKGINIVSKAEAAEWLTRDHVTKVEPEEVAKEFGK